MAPELAAGVIASLGEPGTGVQQFAGCDPVWPLMRCDAGRSRFPAESDNHPSGRVQIQLPPTAAAMIGAIIHGQGANSIASTMLNAKAILAAILPLRLIAPFSRHAMI